RGSHFSFPPPAVRLTPPSLRPKRREAARRGGRQTRRHIVCDCVLWLFGGTTMRQENVSALRPSKEASTSEETLVPDLRPRLTPAQQVERKLVSLLKSVPLPVSFLETSWRRDPR